MDGYLAEEDRAESGKRRVEEKRRVGIPGSSIAAFRPVYWEGTRRTYRPSGPNHRG